MANKPRSAHLHPGPGFRVRVNIERPPVQLMRDLAHFATPDISDQLNRLYAVNSEIRLLTSEHHRICGPALTVKVFPGDNLMVHKAILYKVGGWCAIGAAVLGLIGHLMDTW